jgi:hypothetical protein
MKRTLLRIGSACTIHALASHGGKTDVSLMIVLGICIAAVIATPTMLRLSWRFFLNRVADVSEAARAK